MRPTTKFMFERSTLNIMTYKLKVVLCAAVLCLFCQAATYAQSVYDVVWTDVVGSTYGNNTVTKTDVDGWGNAGAASAHFLPANTDGWIEYTAGNTTERKAFGLSDSNPNTQYTSIDYDLQLGTDANVYVRLNGTQVHVAPYSAGDVLRVERVGTNIYFKQNGTTLYTVSGALTDALIGDMAIYTTTATFANVKASFGGEVNPRVKWTNLKGVAINGSDLMMAGSCCYGNAGATSVATLAAGVDGWVEMTAGELDKTRMIGLASTNVNDGSSIEFAMQFDASANLHVYEDGAQIKYLGKYVAGTVARVSREGSAVKYYMDGVLKHTSVKTSTGSLMIDAAFYHTKATIKGVQLSFGINGAADDHLEFLALKAMYDSLAGSNWTTKTNWPAAGSWPATATIAEMDTWYGVTVSNGDITDLTMTGNNLTGKLPAAIGELRGLTVLNLGNNKLNGTLTSAVGNLTRLNHFYLYTNQITGALPTTMQNLLLLRTLNIASNKFSGTIPAFLNQLTELRTFDLSYNNFTGDLPDLSALVNMGNFKLDACALMNAGPIPSWIGNYTNLTTLQMRSAKRTGPLPASMANLTNLQYLFLDANQLTGSLPSWIGNFTQLINFYINTNQLTGSLPAEIGNLTNLTVLAMNNNQFSGSIPTSLGNLTKLTYLNLSVNSFTGTLPSSIGSLVNLTGLYLQSNQFNGALPPSLGSLTKLTALYIYSNKFSGSIPSELGSLTKLIQFYASGNQLTGSIPATLANLTLIELFYVDNNRLNGELPSFIGNWTKISGFNIAGNDFHGAFPSTIGTWTKAGYIRCDYNKFTSLPQEMLSLPLATSINFDYNELATVPNFANHVNKAALTLRLTNNYLDFSQLEPMYGAGIYSFAYAVQKDIPDITKKTMTTGAALVIASRPLGTNTSIAWEKQNNGTWTNISANDQDAVGNTYTRNSATAADEGTYRWKMTSATITNLTLYSVPIAVKTATGFALDNWAFQYRYDGRNRMTHKKVPGADWVYTVYDNRDRVVMTQDGEQRKTNKWSFIKYDALNRPIMTGIYTHPTSADQASMSALISTTNFYETYTGLAADALTHGYSNSVFPKLNDAAYPNSVFELLTVTYYDNYNFLNNSSGYTYKADDLSGQYDYGNGTAFPRVVGQVTGVKIKALDIYGGWLLTVNHYDDRYRVVQTVADDFKNGLQRTTNVYDFVGKVLQTKTSLINQRVNWTELANVVANDSKKITKNAGASDWIAGAVSSQVLPAGQDGFVEVTYSGGSNYRVIGLSDQNTNAHYNTIDYGFFAGALSETYSQNLSVYENGAARYGFTSKLAVGDKLRVERRGTTIYYKVNGVTIYTSAVPSTTPLMADFSLNYTNSFIYDAKISFGNTEQAVTRRFEYDHAGRPMKTWHKVDSQLEVLLSQNEYNELGQLVAKKLYNTDPSTTPDNQRQFKQIVDYRYNIRGWLTRINNADVNNTTIDPNQPHDLFGMELAYNNTFGIPDQQAQYNGNISAIKWSGNQGFTPQRAYAYEYDPMNRLKEAKYRENTAGWTAPANNPFYEGALDYDLNGNIKSLTRTSANGTIIDQMTYDYGTGIHRSNQLLSVTDASANTEGFKDGNVFKEDYLYDMNGSMIIDKNKDITAITYNFLNLPEKVTLRTGNYIKYIYDATGKKLSQQVYDINNVLKKKSDYAGEYFLENDTLKFISHEEGRVVTAGGSNEYQFFLKDHLGNVRLTFTTKDEQESNTATLEDANAATEQGQFLRYAEARRVQSSIFDHTNGASTGYAQRLNGSANEKYGLAKSLSVMPGDTVKMEVYAKYVDTNAANWTSALNNLLTSIANGTAPGGTVVDGVGYRTSTASFGYSSLLDKSGSTGNGPKAYLNYLIFDREYNFKDGGFVRMTDAAREYGQDVAHEKLSATVTIAEPGYIYIYVSNEEPSLVEVYTDDMSVTHVKSLVVENANYYPFGLVSQSSQRENSLENKYLYNGKEIQDELQLGWYDYGARMYFSEIGKWGGVDASSELYYEWSPYNFCGNNSISFIDLNGKDWFYYKEKNEEEANWHWQDGDEYNTGVKDEDGNDVIIQGVDAVVIYRSEGEQLGEDSNLYGDGAKLADVWVLGPDGADDIQRYEGFTISSDGQRFGVVAEGIHDGNYDAQGKSGSLESNYAIEERGRVPDEDGYNPAHPERGTTNGYLTGVFIHTSNKNGFAGIYQKKYPKGHPKAGEKMTDSFGNPVYGGISEGCLLIAPGRNDDRADWTRFKEQMEGVTNFALDIKRSIPRTARK
ncbi:MAG: RHS repeat-associated core domain-containing protein [Bacteroidota bacterium]